MLVDPVLLIFQLRLRSQDAIMILQSISDLDTNGKFSREVIDEYMYTEVLKENEELQTRCMLLQQDHAKLNIKLSQQSNYISQLEENIKVFKQVVKSSDAEVEKYREELRVEKLKEEIVQLNSQLGQQSNYVLQLEENIKVFKQVVKSMDSSMEKLKEELAMKEKQATQSAVDNFNLVSSRCELERELFVAKREMLGLSQLLSKEKEVIMKVKAIALKLDERNIGLEGILKEEKLENTRLMGKLIMKEKENQDTITNMKSINCDLEKSKDELAVEIIKLRSLRQENEKLADSIAEINQRHNNLLKTLSAKEKDLKKERVKLYYANYDLGRLKSRDERVNEVLLKLADVVNVRYAKEQSVRVAGCIPHGLSRKRSKSTTSKKNLFTFDDEVEQVQQLIHDLIHAC